MMKNIFKISFTTMLLLMLGNVLLAQKAKHKLANQFYQTYDFKKAGEIYKDILSNSKYANDTLALRRVADCDSKRGYWVNAEGYYNQLLATGAAKTEDLKLLAEVLKLQGKYEASVSVYQNILAKNPNDDIAKKYVANPDFANKIMRDSAIYTITNSSINTPASDFAPGFFAGGKVVFSSAQGSTTSNERLYNWTQQPYLNLHTCDIDKDSTLKNAAMIEDKVNSRYHEGTVSYDPSENMIYFTRNNTLRGNLKKSRKGKLNIGIYSAKYTTAEQKFENLTPFQYNNKEYSVGNPALNRSRNRIYFVSNMPGGKGGTDIYYCDKTAEIWGVPVNAGSKINTSGDEMFPFLVGDSTLYFSSNGHLCLGGLDVFYTNPFDTTAAKNVGYPANSHYDDLSMICYQEETVGYFSSNRKNGKGDDDIYVFKIHPPTDVIVTGIVRDLQTLQPLPNTMVTVTEEDGSVIQVLTNERGEYNIKVPYKPVVILEGIKQGYMPTTVQAKTDPRSAYLENVEIKMQKIDYMTTGKALYDKDSAPAVGTLVELFEIANGDTTKLDSVIIGKTGTYMFPLMKNKNYLTVATKEGYSRLTQKIATNDPNNKVHSREFRLFKLEKGTTVRLDNIYYDYNSDVITASAGKELDKLAIILNDNPTMRIELSSHSDSRGSDDYNLKLSDRRAKSAVNYVAGKGINASRMVAKGYGEQKVLNRCKNDVQCTDEEHGFNRRTEFTIL